MRSLNLVDLIILVSILLPTPINALAGDVKVGDLEKAENIVNEFSQSGENVDTDDNYAYIKHIVQGIGTLDSRKKIKLMIEICRDYTPTDQNISEKACGRLSDLAEKNGIKWDFSEITSPFSPLYDVVKE